MKEGWETASLDEVCTIINGLWTGKKPPFLEVGVVRNTNFAKDGSIDYSNIAYLQVELRQFEKRQLRAGDLVLEKSGGGPKQPVGRVALFDQSQGDFSFSNFTSALRVSSPKRVDPRFLHLFLRWIYISGETENMQSHSTGIRNLNLNAYKSIPIPVPPLDEQKRIVALLDEALAGIDTAKANVETNQAHCDALFLSELHQVFGVRSATQGWPMPTVGEVGEHVLGKMLDKQKNRGVPRPYLRNANVRWFEFDLSDVFEMRVEESEVERYAVRRGDLLICEGGYPGRAAIWNGTSSVFFQKALHRVRFASPSTAKWLMYFLFYLDSTAGLSRHFSGTGIQHFTGAALHVLPFPFPDQGEINSLLDRIESVRRDKELLMANYERKVACTESLRDSVLSQAFVGAL